MNLKNRSFATRLGFAISGLIEGLRREQSLRIQSGAAVLVLIVLFVLRPQPLWWAIFIFVIGAVLALELVNTSLEAFIDRVHPERHDSIRVAKDCAAGAVLLMSLVSVAIFLIFVWDRFF